MVAPDPPPEFPVVRTANQGHCPNCPKGCMGTGRDPDQSPTYPCCSAWLCHNSKYPYQTLWSCLNGEKKTKPNLTQPTNNRNNHKTTKTKHYKKNPLCSSLPSPDMPQKSRHLQQRSPGHTVWWQAWVSLALWYDFAIPFLSTLTIR